MHKRIQRKHPMDAQSRTQGRMNACIKHRDMTQNEEECNGLSGKKLNGRSFRMV